MPQTDSQQYHFFKIIADVFSPWYCINTYLNAPEHQIHQTFAFIVVVTLGDYQLNNCIWLATPCYT